MMETLGHLPGDLKGGSGRQIKASEGEMCEVYSVGCHWKMEIPTFYNII